MSEGPAVSKDMESYFSSLREEANRSAGMARRARGKGYDPTDIVEIPFADDLAGRVENLVGPKGIAKRIRELAPKMGREKLLLQISQEVAQSMVDSGEDRQKALDQATRTGLAILTEGVLVAPLEGIAEVKIGSNPDGSSYADLYFAGPIRAAGGTAQAVSVLIADQVRKQLGIGEFKVTDQEVARYIEEFQLYRNLQYRPSNEEIENVVRSCPVCINGEGTEKVEVQGNRDLPRVTTNQVRSGICLVIAEGVLLKAKKILKITSSLEIKGWEFLKKLKGKKKEESGGTEKKDSSCREDEILEKLISMEEIEEEEVGDYLADVDDDGNYMSFTFGDEGDEEEIVQITDEGLTPTAEAAVKYIKDLIAGRPVFSHPSRAGGFRLRYGRGRTCGLASIGFNPLTLFITDEFLATGTQVKIERPGKAGAVTPVDSIDGPTVLLNNGDLVLLDSRENVRKFKGSIRSITDLGEILIPFGEFAENNHSLIQGSYNEDWWKWEVQASLYMKEKGLDAHPFEESFHLEERIRDIRKKSMESVARSSCAAEGAQISKEEIARLRKESEERAESEVRAYLEEAADRADAIEKEISSRDIVDHIPDTGRRAYEVSKELDVPLHPRWTLLWHDIDISDLNRLRMHVMENGSYDEEEGLLIKSDANIKEVLINLCCHHLQRSDGYLVTDHAFTLLKCLGLGKDLRSIKVPRGFSRANNVMKAVNLLSGIRIRERSPTRIGARMGRPEKADLRQMKPPVHGLYPIGFSGGQQRLVKKTFANPVEVNTIPHLCPKCKKMSPYRVCPDCMERNMKQSSTNGPSEGMMITTRDDAERAARILGVPSTDSLWEMKGVKGLISKEKVPERMEKGMLRAKHDVYVFRDGTIRYDMTDITMTHFRPSEIGAPLEKLITLGYTRDIKGEDLQNDDQILELKVQDIVVNEKAGEYLLRVSNFIDDELDQIYGEDRYYNASNKEDLIGMLAIGLAPHTSAGVLCRIIGYTKALGCMGHPFFHASKRRNCDGDEDAVMLLMDGLLNFSRKFLPEKRGGQMDAPLVLSMRLDPSEIDKEAHNVDVRSRYPLDFYLATTRNEKVNDYWMKRLDTVRSRLGTARQFEGFGFSQDTTDLNFSPRISAYKTIGVTEEKIKSQLDLAKLIRAVDEDDVAERVLTTHLLPDLIGNLRSFAQQSFRCTKCGTKYRRITLTGKCTKWISHPNPHRCNNKLILTVSEGSVKKYLGIAQRISEEYNVSNYLRQRIEIMSRSIDSMFPSRFKETTLESFM
ncbi:MAG: DNA polymerase II large subunit [Thermoplasmatota archaeon]